MALGRSLLFFTVIYPCLSAAGIRFLPHPMPSEGLGLPYGRATEQKDTGVDSSGLVLKNFSQPLACRKSTLARQQTRPTREYDMDTLKTLKAIVTAMGYVLSAIIAMLPIIT